MDASLWIGYLEGKFGHYLFLAFAAVVAVMLLKQVRLIGAGSAKLITGAAKDVAALGGKGLSVLFSAIFNFAVNVIVSCVAFFFWVLVCGLIIGWYLLRLLIATIRETREPPTPEFPTAFGWIRLLPIKKPKNAGHGGGHH